jgi:predicted aminopeptidase
MIEAANGDMPRFYAAVKELAKLPKKERCRILTTGLSASSEGC